MSAAAAVEQKIRLIAKSCIDEWSSKATETCDTVVFKASFAEGKRKEGVSKELFEHMFKCLAAMTCWDPEQAREPWQYHVIYDIQAEALEKDVTALCKHKVGFSAKLECDAKGNDAQLRISYMDESPVKVGVGHYAAIEVAIERQSTTRNYIKKDADFTKILVEARKTFTFKEHYDWHYTFILRYREPYYETQDLMADISEKDMTFRDPPMCLVQISSDTVKTTTDSNYFADSFLCKITDLLPHEWKMVPLHLHKNIKKQG